MFNIHRYRLLLNLKPLTFSPNPKTPLPFSLHFCTNSSDSTSFAVSYLIHTFGFDPQFASKLCSIYKLRFQTAQKPDSVLNFFRNHGFSDTQLRYMIAKSPRLLSYDPFKRILPKFQFFLSKGASTSDIINLVSKNPTVLSASLNNQMVPNYELAYTFLKSHHDILACAVHNRNFFGATRVPDNIKLLIKNGVTYSNIVRLLRSRSPIFYSGPGDMLRLVEELKLLGFNPSKSSFNVALVAKATINKTLWKDKVDTFKKWGWSEQVVFEAFRRRPECMLVSINKLNLVMNFWVNELGWDVLALALDPSVFGISFEKRTIPRAPIVQFLLKKGLRKRSASLTCPFVVPEKSFLDKFIKRFENESSYLLKLYEEKLNLAYTIDKTCTP